MDSAKYVSGETGWLVLSSLPQVPRSNGGRDQLREAWRHLGDHVVMPKDR
jgi:hypothetical protein